MLFRSSPRASQRPARKSWLPSRRAAAIVEPLEARRLLTINGYILVDEAHPPAAGTTVISAPTSYRAGISGLAVALAEGSPVLGGEGLPQEITSSINAAEKKQGLTSSDIKVSFETSKPVYSTSFHTTASGATLDLSLESAGDQISFTSTAKTPPKSGNPQFTVTFNMDLMLDYALPSDLAASQITGTIGATASNVTVTTKNTVPGLAASLGVANLPSGAANYIDSFQAALNATIPDGKLEKTLASQLPQGYRTMLIGTNSSGDVVFTALKIYTAAPAISSGTGSYPGSASVKITDATPGAAIRYTTNGSTPTSSSTLYKGPIAVTTSETIKAVAIATDYATGEVASATYTIGAPGALAGSQVTAASKYDLTTLGTTDWVDWGKTVNHKAGATQIGSLTEIKEKGSFFTGADSAHSVSWTNGSPTTADSASDSLVYATGTSAGYSFVVPALKATQTLYILAGGIGAGVHLTAHLSDGSAADYTTSAKPVGTGVFADLFKITFKAATSAATLTVTLENTLNTGRTDLIAAALA